MDDEIEDINFSGALKFLFSVIGICIFIGMFIWLTVATMPENHYAIRQEQEIMIRTHRYRIILYNDSQNIGEWITDPSTSYKQVVFDEIKVEFYVDGLKNGFTIPDNSDMRYTYVELSKEEEKILQ